MEYQVYLNDGQKESLIKYIRDRRYTNMMAMSFSAAAALFCLVYFLLLSQGTTFINALGESGELFVYFAIFTATFAEEFVRGFGKNFGHKCDIQCIEKDLYTLEYGDFVYRDKNSHNRHPYYISDKSYNQYICPKYLDWRNADTGSKFLYIKLDNGRGYAITEDPYMK